VIGVYHGYAADQQAISRSAGLIMASSYQGKGRSAAMQRHNATPGSQARQRTGDSATGFGEVTVNVSRGEKPIILAVSAYEKTNWKIIPQENVVIEKVILSGYHQQTVEGIKQGTPIEVYTYDSSPCENCYQGQGYFYSYEFPPRDKLKQITGLEITSWQGRYSGKEFSIFKTIPILSR
jgi:hypothetical protein